MSKHFGLISVAALATLAACSETPTGTSDPLSGEIVVTEGVAAPVRAARPSLSAADGVLSSSAVGGSTTTPLTVLPNSCSAGSSLQLTFRVTGNQAGTATFKVNRRWVYDGSSWAGSDPVSFSVAPRAAQAPANDYAANLTVVNASSAVAGDLSFTVAAFDITNSNQTGAKLAAGSSASVFVALDACAPPANTAPTLTLPNDITAEATSSSGAAVTFTVTASDLEDGDLTASVLCTPASGSTFTLGETTVNCSVTDNGGLQATGSFKVNVVDTTPAHFTSFPSGTITLIAANINGAVLDVPGLNITVADVGAVSEPSTYACDYVANTALAIGSTTTVSCTAKDALGNESDPSTFDVFVGLNAPAGGFLAPLRMTAPFSGHKRGSTIPHKFLPPTYADGTPAIDLASGLRLVVTQLDDSPATDAIEANDFAAGSTAWRYDSDAGQYIFNLKTGTASPWNLGTYRTTVSYSGIELATTQFDLRR